jgi:hypothetical protein
VANVQAQIKRGFLRQLYEACPDAISFRDALLAFQAAGFTAIKSGRLVVSSSGGGFSTSFEIPQGGRQFSQEQVFALSEEFISIFDDNVVADDDAATFAAMMNDERLQAVTSHYHDFSSIRTGANYG